MAAARFHRQPELGSSQRQSSRVSCLGEIEASKQMNTVIRSQGNEKITLPSFCLLSGDVVILCFLSRIQMRRGLNSYIAITPNDSETHIIETSNKSVLRTLLWLAPIHRHARGGEVAVNWLAQNSFFPKRNVLCSITNVCAAKKWRHEWTTYQNFVFPNQFST